MGTLFLVVLIILLFLLLIGIIKLVKALYFMFSLEHKHRRELKLKSLEQLEKEVFRFENAYFNYIGQESPEVKKFKSYIDSKNLTEIKTNWKALSSRFRYFERNVGHTGRPMLFDYYCWYEDAVNELSKRSAA